jgi:hypothetical protein
MLQDPSHTSAGSREPRVQNAPIAPPPAPTTGATPPFQQAREFLKRVVPSPEDSSGFLNIHWTFQGEGYARPGWSGRACRSIDEAINAVRYAVSRPTTRDLYVCMSLQREAKERTASNGFKYYTPIRSQANAIALKSLFLDIDIKDNNNGYPTLEEAVNALGDFIEAIRLPKLSALVRSGGGIHAYWSMSRALRPREWQPLADALANAARQHGLRCDRAVTADCARVLRVPNTFNWKTNPPRPVTLVGGGRD